MHRISRIAQSQKPSDVPPHEGELHEGELQAGEGAGTLGTCFGKAWPHPMIPQRRSSSAHSRWCLVPHLEHGRERSLSRISERQ